MKYFRANFPSCSPKDLADSLRLPVVERGLFCVGWDDVDNVSQASKKRRPVQVSHITDTQYDYNVHDERVRQKS
jgi:hypothetical protein